MDDPKAGASLEAWIERYKRLEAENQELRAQLTRLGSVPLIPPLSQDRLEAPNGRKPQSSALNSAQKIALFRSLFRGREDVYAQRWESPDGRVGYSPRTECDWKAYYAAKPEDRKRVDKETRKNIPLDDEAIHAHLSGKHTLGVYPLLLDDTCWFLAVDFDKRTWNEDAAEFRQTCNTLGLPASVECSRSGNGAHVWIFFERAVPAIMARRLGSLLLTRTMERRHQLGLDSYDRLFPNQDTMPKGGFGNLIALPLQKAPREQGRSVFLDDEMRSYPDQWGYLGSVKRMTQAAAERLISDALQQGGDLVGVRFASTEDDEAPDPWTLPPSRRRPEKPITGPLPTSVEIVRANLLFIDKEGLPSDLMNRLLRLAAFQNPEFYKAQAMRLATYDKPRVIACGEDLPRHLALPRGCLAEVTSFLEGLKIKTVVRDERAAGRPIDAMFNGSLRPTQEEAVAKVLQHDDGLICAPTAFGKTAVAAWLIAKRGVNTLVMVHRQQLLDQWREHDYVDSDVLMLARMYGRRRKGYADMGYNVLSDAQRRLDL